MISGVLIADGAIEKTLRHDTGSTVFSLAEFVLFTVFFWWSLHFLLAGRQTCQTLLPAALATGLFWVDRGVFASLYFSRPSLTTARPTPPSM